MCFGFCRRRDGAADGAVSVGRQVGTDGSASAGSDDADLAARVADVIPVAVLGASERKLYIWAQVCRTGTTHCKNGVITADQAHAIHWKRPMLNTWSFYLVSMLSASRFSRLYIFRLNRWSLKRDADPSPGWVLADEV